MVTGGSAANVIYNLCKGSTKFGGKNLIDYDIALLSEPCMLLGVSVGVICNLVFPEWLITILFALFLAWSTSMSCKNGLLNWKMESEELMMRNDCENLGNGLNDETQGVKGIAEPILGTKGKGILRLPWTKMGVLVLVFFLHHLPSSWQPVWTGYHTNRALWNRLLGSLIIPNPSCHNLYSLDPTQKREPSTSYFKPKEY